MGERLRHVMMSSHFITLLGHPNGRRFDPDLIEIGSFERFKLKLSLELFLICQVARQNPRQDRQRSSSFQNSIFARHQKKRTQHLINHSYSIYHISIADPLNLLSRWTEPSFLYRRGEPTMKKPTYILLEPLKPCHFICRNRSCFIPQRPVNTMICEKWKPISHSTFPSAAYFQSGPNSWGSSRTSKSSGNVFIIVLVKFTSSPSRQFFFEIREKRKSIVNREGGVNWSFYTDSRKIVLSQPKLK